MKQNLPVKLELPLKLIPVVTERQTIPWDTVGGGTNSLVHQPKVVLLYLLAIARHVGGCALQAPPAEQVMVFAPTSRWVESQA